MFFEKSTVGNVVIAKVGISRLDIQSVDKFRSETKALVSADSVILNLESVEFIDSTGLGALLSLFRHLKAHGGELCLASIGTQVRTIFRLVRMNRVFEVYRDVEDALNCLQKRNLALTSEESSWMSDSSAVIEEIQ